MGDPEWQSEEGFLRLTRTNLGNFTRGKSQFPTGFRSQIGVRRAHAILTQEGQWFALLALRRVGARRQSSLRLLAV